MPDFRATYRDPATGETVEHIITAPDRNAARTQAGYENRGELLDVFEVSRIDPNMPEYLRRRRTITYFHPVTDLTAGELRSLITRAVATGAIIAGVLLVFVSAFVSGCLRAL